MGLSVWPCENCPSFRRSAAAFFLQFPLQNSLEKALFGRLLVQLILAALSLYPFGPFGVKEGGLFPAPQALDSGLLGLPGFDSGVLACPRKIVFPSKGFVFALCAFRPKTNERTNKPTNEPMNKQANKQAGKQAKKERKTQTINQSINRSIDRSIDRSIKPTDKQNKQTT